ncbi:MAG TPA: tyrosine-type recombinase/integrase [Acidisarcina sp.]|nr:tyrosine-type recombinase/integrase [Acidisarcina sp.]
MAADPSHPARYIRPTTERTLRQYIESLRLFFGALPLEKIHPGHLKQYQIARTSGTDPFIRIPRGGAKEKGPSPASPLKCNQELALLKAIMKRGKAWTPELDDAYEPLLVEEQDIPRALTMQEQRIWLDVSRSREKWMVAHWYSQLAFATTMSTNEERALRIGDINLYQQVISVPYAGAKNKYRHRTIELVGADVLWAVERLVERARELGSVEPQHYLFPLRHGTGPYHPDQPMTSSGLKRAWNELRVATGLTWFRPYDTRHTAITRMAEAGTPIDIIMSRAGHVGERMRRHYTHISQAAQRRWVTWQQSYEQRIPPQPDYYGPVAQQYGSSRRWS